MTGVFYGANWWQSGQKTARWFAVVIRWLVALRHRRGFFGYLVAADES